MSIFYNSYWVISNVFKQDNNIINWRKTIKAISSQIISSGVLSLLVRWVVWTCYKV